MLTMSRLAFIGYLTVALIATCFLNHSAFAKPFNKTRTMVLKYAWGG